MKLNTMKNAVTSRVSRQILIGRKHSPVILFAGGVVGVVGTTVLACRATLKLEEILDESEADREKVSTLEHVNYSEKDRAKDHHYIKVRTGVKIVKAFAPAVGLGVISIGALTGSHVVLSRRNVALTAAYSALDRGFNEYRARVREEFGDDKERELRHGGKIQKAEVLDAETGKMTAADVMCMAGEPSIYARFFDEYSDNWNKNQGYNQVFVRCQQNYANDMLNARGHVFLNEVYDMLGFPRSKEGAVVGWVKGNGDNEIDFGVFAGDTHSAQRFVNGDEKSILLDFNVDGVIYDKI